MKYPIKQKDYESLYQEQGGVCKICSEPLTDKYHPDEWESLFVEKPIYDSVVDHDHETGEVRGILCRKCNSAIGFFNEVPWTIMESIRYILNLNKLEYIEWLQNVLEYRIENLGEE